MYGSRVKVLTVTLGRAWRLGAGPPKSGVVIDLDSTICPVSGKEKQGAAYGYTGELGYHPLLAFRADTGEVVGARLREGGSQRGVVHFARETIGRIRRAGARGRIVVRADSGFWSYAMLVALNQRSVGWSITARLNRRVKARISRIEEEAWTSIDYPRDGEAQVAETTFEMINPKRRSETLKVRLVVRRTRLVGHQAQLWPDWRHHAFVTNLAMAAAEADRHHQPHTGVEDDPDRRTEDDERRRQATIDADRHHRAHASCELAIRDLKEAAGLAHLPSGVFFANAAWLLCAALAHNLYRHIAHLGKTQPKGRLVRGRTIRTRLFGLPERLVNHSGQPILRLPARWPWANTYLSSLTNLRNLPQLC